jgi:hypothetical protein
MDKGPVLVVLFTGGVTYSEVRIAYALAAAHKRLILVGGTDISGPRPFLADLENLHDPSLSDHSLVVSLSRPRV